MPQCFEILAERDRLKALNADMLAALKLAEDHLQEDIWKGDSHPVGRCPVLDVVRAAIAKAEGEDVE